MSAPAVVGGGHNRNRMSDYMARATKLLEEMREDNRLHREELRQHREELELYREESRKQHELAREESRKQHELAREESRRWYERELRQHRVTQAAVQNNQRVLRELVLRSEQDRKILERVEQGIHAQTQGLLHVLDELRGGRGGAGTAPA